MYNGFHAFRTGGTSTLKEKPLNTSRSKNRTKREMKELNCWDRNLSFTLYEYQKKTMTRYAIRYSTHTHIARSLSNARSHEQSHKHSSSRTRDTTLIIKATQCQKRKEKKGRRIPPNMAGHPFLFVAICLRGESSKKKRKNMNMNIRDGKRECS